jgi:hypothetical protein
VIEGLALQQDEPISSFLRRHAKKLGYRFKVDKGVFHFHRPTWEGAKFEVVEKFVYGAGPDILKLDIDADFRLPIPNRVKAKSYDPVNRLMLVGDLDHSQAQQRLNVGGGWMSDFMNDPERSQTLTRTESGLTVGSLGTANKRAQARFVDRHWAAFKINMTVVGNWKLLAARLIEIGGTGSPLVDGVWYISEARHRVTADEYVTDIHLKHPKKKPKPSGNRFLAAVQDANYDKETKTPHIGGGWQTGFTLRRGIRTRR